MRLLLITNLVNLMHKKGPTLIQSSSYAMQLRGVQLTYALCIEAVYVFHGLYRSVGGSETSHKLISPIADMASLTLTSCHETFLTIDFQQRAIRLYHERRMGD